MAVMLNRIVDQYNNVIDAYPDLSPAEKVSNSTLTETECTVTGFLQNTYEKYPDFFS